MNWKRPMSGSAHRSPSLNETERNSRYGTAIARSPKSRERASVANASKPSGSQHSGVRTGPAGRQNASASAPAKNALRLLPSGVATGQEFWSAKAIAAQVLPGANGFAPIGNAHYANGIIDPIVTSVTPCGPQFGGRFSLCKWHPGSCVRAAKLSKQASASKKRET